MNSVFMDPDSSWYCLRTQIKRERLAAQLLKSRWGIEVYLPLLQHRKKTTRGPVKFTEALFPGYLFARFNLNESLTRVRTAPGISGIVHFNQQYQPVPCQSIEELRAIATDDEVLVVDESFTRGDSVQVVEGSLCGVKGLVQSYLPAKERITILLEFLGREAEVTLPTRAVLPDKMHPLIG